MIKTTITKERKLDEAFHPFLMRLPYIFDIEGDTLYQERNVVKVFYVEDSCSSKKKVVVKRYKRPALFQRFIYSFFRASKAQRAFKNSIVLRHRGISTPHEIAYLEEYKGALLTHGYYVSDFTDAIPIKEALEDNQTFSRMIADGFASFVATLHERGILHHDLNSTNVLYSVFEGEYHFSVIDINRMKILSEGASFSRKACFDNLTRFTGSMNLFEYVAAKYIKCRKWDECLLAEAIDIKEKHDKVWQRRKAFLKKLRFGK